MKKLREFEDQREEGNKIMKILIMLIKMVRLRFCKFSGKN